MNKNNIETFAVKARKQLIENLTYEANRIGISKEEILEPTTNAEDMQTFTTAGITNTIYGKKIEQRKQLIQEIDNNGFENTIEKIAYTWFNRIIAIRFMEVNNYLPTHTRVLSSIIPEKKEPDIIEEALNLDLNYTPEDIKQIYEYKEENNTDALFKLLFIKQCNKLNEILPELFETIDDYTEILFNIQLSNEKNIIYKLIEAIPEEDFQNQVEILGWMYQYYNKELKDDTFKKLKKNIKITKETIPPATQIFTPKWIVKYMVENSLGRLWLNHYPESNLIEKWDYLIVENELITNHKNESIMIENVKIIDPCMGSGHILTYLFDILMDIYLSLGYTEKEATITILEKNIYGLDIDERAYQLAYFALMMKARSYYPRIFNKNIKPILTNIEESKDLSDKFIKYLTEVKPEIIEDVTYVKELFYDAKLYGSIINCDNIDFKEINDFLVDLENNKNSMVYLTYKNDIILLKKLLLQFDILSKKYDVVITNPPYMSSRGMNSDLINYLKEKYPNTKSDMSTVFMEKAFDLTKKNGFISMINIPVWMYIASYEKLRENIIKNKSIVNMLHLGRGIFGSDFGTTSFVIYNSNIENYDSIFYQLYEDKGAVDSIEQKEEWFLNKKNIFSIKQEKFLEIHGIPISYWINDNFVEIFKNEKVLSDFSDVKQGLATGSNDKFLRLWFEIEKSKIEFECSSCTQSQRNNNVWYPYNKGGNFRKWYGNHEYVVNWHNDGNLIRNFKDSKGKLKSRPQNTDYYFKPAISWSLVSSGKIAFRYYPPGFIFDVAGCSIFTEQNFYYLLAFLNSKVSDYIVDILAPTINFSVGYISNIPTILNEKNKDNIIELSKQNVNICKNDFNEQETSWNFTKHPLMKENSLLENNFEIYKNYKEDQFNLLKSNEIKLNELFTEIYHENSIDTYVEDKYVSVRKAEYETDIKSFISYAVGCIFGRYSLDEEGLIFSGGDFNQNRYSKFIPDEDNIIPVLEEEYFEDDIVNRFIEFIKIGFGKDNLDENLEFIANALNNKGNTNREIIRNYFVNDFFEDHLKMYSVTMRKAPIYWMFDSGKQNSFKCLINIHRYEPKLISRIRHDYLLKTQQNIDDNLQEQQKIINESENKTRIRNAENKKSKLLKQKDEIKLYDLALEHIANKKIELDLDDGVKDNYKKFQNIEVIDPKSNKKKKINLLRKL